jgi:dihydrofolate synthase/folylpolyglutamate synthase
VRLAEALADLDTRQPEGSPKPDLERMRALFDLLDDPQRTYPTIHVTGTNGKTTTSRLAAAIACAHGLPTGLYTSPHLLRVTERMAVCGEPIGEAEFADEYERLLPFLTTVDQRVGQVTYFEALTTLGLLWFADKPVDLAVVEVGMGGTWDATNLVDGEVAVICPIGIDHPELGATEAAIAGEKSGIIKDGKVAVVREQIPSALDVIEARCRSVGATLRLEGRDWALQRVSTAVGGQSITVRGLHGTYEDVLLSLFGSFAGANAAAAIVAVESLLGRELDDDALREALATATSPGRLEVVGRRPLIVLDGAHNPAAARALAEALPATFTWDRLHLVMAAFADKDTAGVVAALAPLADRTYAAANGNARSRDPEDMAAILAAAGAPGDRFASVAAALAAATDAASEGDCILVTGSLYTVADARRALEGTP